MKELTLECKRETFKLHLPGGKDREVELREMTAAVRDKHMDFIRSRMNAENVITKYDAMQAELLCRCLYDKATDQLIPIAEIQSWPASCVTYLHEQANDMHKVSSNGDLAKNG